MLTLVRFSRELPKQSEMAAEFVCFSFALLLMIQLAIASPPISKPNCESSCGNLSIPYPFGMGKKECYFDEWFEIECNTSVHPPRAFLSRLKLELIDLSLGHVVSVKSPIISSNCSGRESDEPIDLTKSPFYISKGNSFIAAGCNSRALLMDEPLLSVGCESRCHGKKDIDLQEMLPEIITTNDVVQYNIRSDCNGTDCCKIQLPSAIQVFNPSFVQGSGGCKLAFLVYADSFPMQLDWNIDSTLMKAVDRETAECSKWRTGYDPKLICDCKIGYKGNPYIGCTGKLNLLLYYIFHNYKSKQKLFIYLYKLSLYQLSNSYQL